jgi:PIN domain nuclease of toxin-antitoxin system
MSDLLLGKVRIGSLCQAFLSREIAVNNFELLPISLDHATRVETLASHHKDPFGRLLAAQATLERLPLVSADEVFDRYGVSRLW